ncbi:MAG TPA: mechanosensitive ion channel domain-containing protein, partial [Acetobacteraceae bacterium]
PAAAPAAEPILPVPLAPDSLGAQLVVGASERLSHMSDDLADTARSITDFPLILRWLTVLATDPDVRAQLLAAAWKLLLVLAIGLGAEWGVVRLLQRPARALEARAPAPAAPPHDDIPVPEARGLAEAEAGQSERLWRKLPRAIGLLHRLPFALGRLVLDLLPVLAVLAVGYGALGLGRGIEPVTRLVILAALNAYVLYRVVMSITRMLVAPDSKRLRLAAIPDDTAAYILRWTRRIAAIAIFGYAVIEAGLLFGLYRLGHDALLKLLALVVHALLVIIILQCREGVAERIEPRPGATGLAARVRRVVAPLWHIVAIIYVMALWLVQALEVPDGATRLLRVFLVTAAILAAGRLVLLLLLGAMNRFARLGAGLSHNKAGVEARVSVYSPMARTLAKVLVSALTIIVLLEAWGFPAISWFSSGALGGRLVAALSSVGVTILLALLVWEAVNAAIQRHLARLVAQSQLARSARLRTLLPMLRTALLVAICVVVGLMVLSEIGVNIAPLLAGAGVIGIAIGFGSQKLVQDVITGLFLLLENTMQVGDVVTLASLSGTVENLSVRTIRLRAVDGAVHIVPFSAVTTVTNMTRDFAYAVVDVSVGLNEEPDRITGVLQGIAREMRAEDRWAPVVSADLEVMGVEKFLDNAWVLRVRLRTTASQRWAVTRELNRRIKYR